MFPKNSGFPPPNHPFLIGFSIIFTIHFGGKTPIQHPLWFKWLLVYGSYGRKVHRPGQLLVDDLEVHFINVHGENAHFVGFAIEKDETGIQQFCGTIILFARLQLVVGSSYL